MSLVLFKLCISLGILFCKIVITILVSSIAGYRDNQENIILLGTPVLLHVGFQYDYFFKFFLPVNHLMNTEYKKQFSKKPIF